MSPLASWLVIGAWLFICIVIGGFLAYLVDLDRGPR